MFNDINRSTLPLRSAMILGKQTTGVRVVCFTRNAAVNSKELKI